jgi:hypothetical protein
MVHYSLANFIPEDEDLTLQTAENFRKKLHNTYLIPYKSFIEDTFGQT